MTNHLKLKQDLLGLLLPSRLSLFLGLWVFVTGAVLALSGSNLLAGFASGLGFWFFSLLFILKDLALFDQPRPLSWSPLSSLGFSPLLNPTSDIDPSSATDADDLVVFVADIFEFAEHEQALLLDSLTEVFTGAALAGVSGASAALSVRSLKAR
jgi:hypothetical protein